MYANFFIMEMEFLDGMVRLSLLMCLAKRFKFN